MSEVEDFLKSVEPERRHREAGELNALFREVTGWEPRFYKGGMLGYGRYDYTYDSGHSGTAFATGFAPRKAKLSIYIMPGYANFGGILDRLGKHSMGKACLYVNKLPDVDLAVLAELIRAGLDDLGSRWEIRPT